jgi:hypothetical protein
VVAPALIIVGSNILEIAGVLFFVAGVVVCAWLVAMSRTLLVETPSVGHYRLLSILAPEDVLHDRVA